MQIRLFLLSALVALPLFSAHGQGLRPSPSSNARPPNTANPTGASVPAATTGAVRQADFIVAVVNSEPITNQQVRAEVQRTLQQLAQSRRSELDAGEQRALTRQILERLIGDRAQLQVAKDSGIRIDEPSVDQAVLSVARQNQIEVAELQRRLAADGIAFSTFREQLREQLLLTRLREREVEPRVRVTDAEVDQYLQEQQGQGGDPNRQQINLAQILVAVPENATAAQLAPLQAKAQNALARARAGEDFAALARALSDAPDRASGGQLGLRAASRYPTLFVEATQALAAGAVADIVRSGAGLHVLKVIEKRAEGLPPVVVTQSRARHILLRADAQLTEAGARDRLADYKKRIQAGQADFAALARAQSQDGSAEKGGDLGWANPGQFVPEFEAVLNQLAPGQISDPLISRFGVHLIQLMERRDAEVSQRDQREMVRGMLREKRLETAYLAWAQDIRARAYVEMREAPQ